MPTKKRKPHLGARCRRDSQAMCLAVVAFTAAIVFAAPLALADASAGDSLRTALIAARATSCSALRSEPLVEQTADAINGSTDKYLNHAARTVPETEALPLLKDLGYSGTKATILSSAAVNKAEAIQALLLQGYLKIPDCSYTDYGASALYNETKQMILMTVVLAA